MMLNQSSMHSRSQSDRMVVLAIASGLGIRCLSTVRAVCFGTCRYVLVTGLLLLVAAPATSAPHRHRKPAELKPTEKVVAQYRKLISSGALLTPEGWKKSSTLFVESKPYPKNGTIHLFGPSDVLGEDWVKDNRAQVESKWDDDFGSIDSSLRYTPPQAAGLARVCVYSLAFTNTHRNVLPGGKISQSTGDWAWKLEDTQQDRWATVEQAIVYVSKVCANSTSPAIRRNASKTLIALRRLLKSRPSACAC